MISFQILTVTFLTCFTGMISARSSYGVERAESSPCIQRVADRNQKVFAMNKNFYLAYDYSFSLSFSLPFNNDSHDNNIEFYNIIIDFNHNNNGYTSIIYQYEPIEEQDWSSGLLEVARYNLDGSYSSYDVLSTVINIIGDNPYYDNDIFNKLFSFNGGTFTFTDVYNPNYGLNTSSNLLFVNGSPSVKNIFNYRFISNNQYFDSIRMRYISGTGSAYYDNEGQVQIYTGTGVYFFGLEYYGDGYVELASSYEFESYNSGGSYNYALTNKLYWLNYNFQKITFIDTPSDSDLSYLEGISKNAYNGGYSSGGTGSITLSSAFSLINLCLTAFTGLFSYMVLPGISIGLLIAIPLLLTLMLFIIKLFKR